MHRSIHIHFIQAVKRLHISAISAINMYSKSTTLSTSLKACTWAFTHRLRCRFTSGTPSIRLIDCSLPGLLDPGDVVVADVDRGIRVGVHITAAMPAYVSVPLPRSLVYRLAYTALLARIPRIHKLHHYAVPLALVGNLELKARVWPVWKPFPHGLIAPAFEPLHVHGWQIFKDIWRYIILWIVYININIVWYFKKCISNIIINVHKWILSCCLCIPWCN